MSLLGRSDIGSKKQCQANCSFKYDHMVLLELAGRQPASRLIPVCKGRRGCKKIDLYWAESEIVELVFHSKSIDGVSGVLVENVNTCVIDGP